MAELTYSEVDALLKYDPETGKLFWKERPVEMCPSEAEAKRWNTVFAGKEALASLNQEGYLKGAILGRHYVAHRVVWMLNYKEWPNQIIDHINGVKTDNRIENLRDVSVAENHKNQRARTNNTSGFRGVYWNKASGKWQAYIREQNRSVHLGMFNDFNAAVAARVAAELRNGYHPNHGRPN